MKKYFCAITIIFISTILFAASEEVTAFFNAGNSLYQEGKYTEAKEKYEQCIDSGYVSGPLYYNLGNCCFKLGNLGKTIVFYRRAEKLLPRDPEIKANLNYVNSLLEDRVMTPQKNWFLDKVGSIVKLFSLGNWISLSAFLWLLLVCLGIVAIFFRKLRKFCSYLAITSIILLIVCFHSIFVQYESYITPRGIVLVKELPVYYGPSEGDVEAFVLHEGAEVAIKKQERDWCQIQIADGKAGWVSAASIEKI